MANARNAYKPLLHATRGIVFLGTPHHGSALASSGWLGVAQHLVAWAQLKHTSTRLAKELEPFSETLRNVSNEFVDIAGHILMRSFIEQKTTRLLPPLKGDCLVCTSAGTLRNYGAY